MPSLVVYILPLTFGQHFLYFGWSTYIYGKSGKYNTMKIVRISAILKMVNRFKRHSTWRNTILFADHIIHITLQLFLYFGNQLGSFWNSSIIQNCKNDWKFKWGTDPWVGGGDYGHPYLDNIKICNGKSEKVHKLQRSCFENIKKSSSHSAALL